MRFGIILKVAYKAGMIRDENLWREALESRNNVAHAYNESITLDIVKRTKENYIDMFDVLEEELKTNWL